MYSYQMVVGNWQDPNNQPHIVEMCKAKGIGMGIVRDLFNFREYQKQLMYPARNRQTNRRFANHNHEITTLATQKLGLCAFDTKRWVLCDGVNTLALGHKSIPSVATEDGFRAGSLPERPDGPAPNREIGEPIDETRPPVTLPLPEISELERIRWTLEEHPDPISEHHPTLQEQINDGCKFFNNRLQMLLPKYNQVFTLLVY